MEILTDDEKAVFYSMSNCELSLYVSSYAPDTSVVSTGDIARMHSWTMYRAKKAIRGLVSKEMIERVSRGNPAVVSFGEYEELVCEPMPPTNGYAISKKGFDSKEWKGIYKNWCKELENWAKGVWK